MWERFSNILLVCWKIVRLNLSYLVWLFPSNENIWVFTSHDGGTFAENAKYQYLYSSRQPGVRAIWISTDREVVDELTKRGYEAYSYRSLRGKYFAFRSGFMFFTHNARAFIPYSGNSVTLQLWHGNMLKRMGQDTRDTDSLPVRLYHLLYGRGWDYFLVTSSSYPSENAKSAYGLEDDDLLVAGYPRTDVFYRDVEGSMIGVDTSVEDQFARLSSSRSLICYLPTWNSGRDEKTRFSESQLDLAAIDDRLEELEAILLIKQHPYTRSPIDDSPYENIVSIQESIDVYPLLEYTDALITDYSSVYFDYLLLDNPLIFYPYDLDRYTTRRGLYFRYDEITPGPKANRPAQLPTAIASSIEQPDEYGLRRASIRDEFFEFQDGKSCSRIHSFLVNT